MFARVSTYQGPPDRIGEAIRIGREQVMPAAAKLAGYRGAYLLVDRKSGKSISVTLWESETDLRASEEAADRLRAQGAAAGSAQILSVERFEVATSDIPVGAAKR